MPRKNRHPQREILELANGSLAAASREAVEAHLAECNKCAMVAAVVGGLKNQARLQAPSKAGQQSEGSGLVAYGPAIPAPRAASGGGPGRTGAPPTGRKDLEFKDLLLDINAERPMFSQGTGSEHRPPPPLGHDGSTHLGAADLASFFYGELPRDAAAAAAGHLALCSECSSAISLYSDSEAAAQTGGPSALAGSVMSEENWELIKEWEENCLAEPRPECDALSREMLERFVAILRDHREEIDRVVAGSVSKQALGPGAPQIVPVVVLDALGAFRGVEAFHRIARPRGLEALQCPSLPDRFNNLPIHALLGAERHYPMVVSGWINRGMAELDYSSMQASLMRPLGYFIVEN